MNQRIMPSAGGTRVRLMRHGRLSALGGPQMDLAPCYAPEFWRPQQHLSWPSEQLELARRGQVIVGEVEAETPAEADPARRPAQ